MTGVHACGKGRRVIDSTIPDEETLEELLSQPSDGAIATLGRLAGDLVVLGVGGKMGPSLARMARRASQAAGVQRRIIGVARFTRPGLQDQLHSWGVETIACDLLDAAQVRRLPEAALVVAMTGMKFGATGQEALTWAMNAHVPALICEKYRTSRIVAFSTGNVYGMSPIRLGGSLETDPPQPVGEYSMSCLGRERITSIAAAATAFRWRCFGSTTRPRCATACWWTWQRESEPDKRLT